jgi:hypothetical protein
MSFNRVVNFSEAGNSGVALADALGIEADQDLELTELMSVLFDRLYRLGAVRNMDGTRARRRRASSRAADKRRREASRERARERQRENAAAARRERRRERARSSRRSSTRGRSRARAR